MPRRARLPGADELFRRTSEEPQDRQRSTTRRQDDKSTTLQVAEVGIAVDAVDAVNAAAGRAPRHDQKITFYCTTEDLMAIESARLELRAAHGIAADRGRLVRAALTHVLDDLAARGDQSILVRALRSRQP